MIRALPRRRTVADVMTKQVHIAGPDTPFKLLVRMIEENHVSAVPIVDQRGTPIGIVSEADLLFKERRSELQHGRDLVHRRKRRQQRAKAEGTIASELMTSPALTVPAGATLVEAARKMQERNVRRLIVVDPQGRIAGVVSRSDILQVFLRSDVDLRNEISNVLIPAVLPEGGEGLRVDAHWNVVTLSGHVNRRSDAQMLMRLTGEVDGVVSVVDHMTFEWDDLEPPLEPALAVNRSFMSY